MAERWLVISYWANVEGMACSYHIDDRLRHLLACGVEVEMITSICGPRPRSWGDRWHRVPSPSASGYRFEVRHLARAFRRPWNGIAKTLLVLPILPLYWVEQCVVRLESTFWWWAAAVCAGLWRTRRRRPDLIYSTGGAMSAHLAAAVIARLRRLPWMAEIQDPLPYQGLGRGPIPRWLVTKLERMIHSRATGVVYLTQAAAERAAARTGGAAACRAIYAGAGSPVAVSNRARGDYLCLLHAGTLSGSRTPETLLSALANLAARNDQVRREIRLTLLGATDAAVRRMAETFSYPEMLEVIEKLPRREAWERVERADLLLVIQNLDRVSEETIPSKTYEYLVSGRAVLGLVYRNLELAAILREAGHRVVQVDDVAAIEAELENLYEAWRGAGLMATPCDRYTAERAVAELIAWSRDLRAPERTAARV